MLIQDKVHQKETLPILELLVVVLVRIVEIFACHYASFRDATILEALRGKMKRVMQKQTTTVENKQLG